MYDYELLQAGEKQIYLDFCEEEYINNITEIIRCLKAFKELTKIVQPLAV